MKYFVTGGAGFIGSNLVDRLLQDSCNQVKVYDNLSTGNIKFLDSAKKTERLTFVQGDNLDFDLLAKEMKGNDFIFHFAANADIRFGLEHPKKDLEQNTIATFNILEAMRMNGITKIAFPSTGPIYGESKIIPTPEDAPLPIQTSLYGASKLACEGLIEAYCEGYGFTSYIYRFVSILGERYTHGHVFDFVKKLKENPKLLYILGNGKQKKSYLYVSDCIDAILLSIEKSKNRVNIYNLGVDSYCQVNDSARWVCDEMHVTPRFDYSGGERGWIGDNPFIYLDTGKIRAIGWKPKYSIEEGVRRTVRYLLNNQWVMDERLKSGINQLETLVI